MNNGFTRSALAIAVAALPLTGLAVAQAADFDATPGTSRFVTLPPKPSTDARQPATVLPTWNGSFSFNGHNYTYNMVGTDPSTGTSTTVKAFIVPIKVVITASGGTQTTFDPAHVLSNGKTVIQNTAHSPIFDTTTTYTQGGVNVGTTQYLDAYQRANFWGVVQNKPNYHVRLSPQVLNTITLSPPSSQGKTGRQFGITAGEVNINWFDAALNKIITKLTQIQPNTVPIFLTYNVYLTDFGCCIGGYHSATGAQSYMHATYVDLPGAFAQDVSALSHEVGEWMDDPLVNNSGNNSPCGILENGDPLENNPNYGAYPYTLGGFQYNLQDLVTLPYFGAPASTSVNGFFTFQGQTLSVCQNGS